MHDPAGMQTALLIRNLRLLDLDEEFDYPHITPGTFAASSPHEKQSERAQCAQWILYKLFKLWDPHVSQKALKPHFPATSPQQSIELQTELCNCLGELKKSGLIGRNVTVTTKTLQECRGANFERLLANFSTRVLYKKVTSDEDDLSTAKQCLSYGSLQMQDCTVPVGLAYEHALTTQIRERAILEKRWRKFGRTLFSKGEELQGEEQIVDAAGSPRKDKKVSRRILERLRQYVDMNWSGDKQWVDVLLMGDNKGLQNDMLDRPFSDVWDHATKDTLYAIRGEDRGSILQDLERRVQKQSSRLERWKSIREDLSEKSSAANVGPEKYAEAPQRVPRRNHQPANSDWQRDSSPQEGLKLPSQGLRNHKAKRMTTDGPTTRSKSSLQAAPIQVETYLPARETNRRPYHLRSRTAETLKGADPSKSGPMDDTSSQQRSDPSALFDLQTNTNHTEDEVGPTAATTASSHGLLPELKQLPSLAERTRMSMALMSPLKRGLSAPTNPLISQSGADRPRSAGRPDTGTQPPSMAELDTLAERARQSMNLTAAKTPAPKRPRKTRTSSLNDTRKAGARRMTQPAEDMTDTTLLEEALQNMDGDYESVFKSRPRVALSPVISPLRGATIDEVMNLNGHASGDEDDFS